MQDLLRSVYVQFRRFTGEAAHFLGPLPFLAPYKAAMICCIVLVGTRAFGQVSANDDFASLAEDASVIVTVQDNDDNFGMPPLTTTLVDGPFNGSATVVGFTAVEYTPNLNFAGTDTVRYEVCNGDPTPSCDQALLILTVLPQNDPPEAINDTFNVFNDAATALDVQLNDIDIDGDALESFVTEPPLNGTAIALSLDSILYTPDAGFLGTDSFVYRVCDPGSFCDDATVYLTVSSSNGAPIASPDMAVTLTGLPVSVEVLANDTDPDGDGLEVVSVTEGPLNGTATVTAGTGIRYVPSAGFTGYDTLRYQVCDDQEISLCDQAWLLIRVDEFVIPNSFSPNNDGTNDAFVIDGLEAYPDSRVVIVDRRGEVIIDSESYDNNWRGIDPRSGKEVPEDVYFYQIQVAGISAAFSGSILIRR